MSLRNLQKVVSASTFASKVHNCLLQSYGRTFSPASYYFNSTEKHLQPGHSHDPFTLSLVASELTRQNINLHQALRNLSEDSKSSSISIEITEKIAENSVFIENFSREMILQLKSKSFDFPVETCSNVIYTLENNGKSNKELYQSILFPIIKEKLDYMSLQGLINLVNGLANSKAVHDKTLVKAVLMRLEEKISRLSERNLVGFSAWKIDRFEEIERKNEVKSEYLQFVEENKKNAYFGSFMHWIRVSYEFLENNLLFRMFYREKRVERQFDKVDEKEELIRLRGDLEKLQALDESFDLKELVKNKLKNL